MAGANYMGGKRNSARTRSKDSRGRAEKHHFGRKRVELLQKSLAAPHSATPLADATARQYAALPIELDHASRDTGSRRTENAYNLTSSHDNGSIDGEERRAKKSSRVLVEMDIDPTSVSYRSTVSHILRVSNTTGLISMRGRLKTRSTMTRRNENRSGPANIPVINRSSGSSSASASNPPLDRRDDCGFEEDVSGMDPGIEESPFAFVADIGSQGDGEAAAASDSSSRPISSRGLLDIKNQMQARYADVVCSQPSPSHTDAGLAHERYVSPVSPSAQELGATSLQRLFPTPRPGSSGSHGASQSVLRTEHGLPESSSGPLLRVGDLLEEPDAWDAAGLALGFLPSQQSNTSVQSALYRSASSLSTVVEVDIPPAAVDRMAGAETYPTLVLPTAQVDEPQTDIDWDIIDHEEAVSTAEDATAPLQAETARGLQEIRPSGELCEHPTSIDMRKPVPSLDDIDLDALFAEDQSAQPDVTAHVDASKTPARPHDGVTSSTKPTPLTSSTTLSHPPPYHFALQSKAPASMPSKPLSKLKLPIRPVFPLANTSGRVLPTAQEHSSRIPDRVDNIDKRPKPLLVPLAKRDSAERILFTPNAPSKAATPIPLSSQAAIRELCRSPEPVQQAPEDDFLDNLFNDVMPNLPSTSPAPQPSTARPALPFELF